MSPLNSNNSFFSQLFDHSQQVKTILTIGPQLKFTKFKWMFSFSFVTIYALSFLKMFVFWGVFYAVFNSVQVSFPLFFYSVFFHCSVVLFFWFLLINCSFTIFFNLISASLCLYLNIITIGSLIKLFQWYSFFFQQVSLQKHGLYPAIISSFLLVPNTATQC